VSDRPVDIVSDNVDCVIRGGDLLEQSLVARRVGNVPLVTVASPRVPARTARRPSVRAGGQAHDGQLLLLAHRRPYPHVFEKDGETWRSTAATSWR
jgi:LysR family transcriptional regulator for bpeEF and oprC